MPTKNPYEPPQAALTPPNPRSANFFRTSGLMLATFFGGAAAAAVLVFMHLNAHHRPRRALIAAIALAAVAILAVYVDVTYIPNDPISELTGIRLPEMVLVYLVLKASLIGVSRPTDSFRPNWHATRVGCLILSLSMLLNVFLRTIAKL